MPASPEPFSAWVKAGEGLRVPSPGGSLPPNPWVLPQASCCHPLVPVASWATASFPLPTLLVMHVGPGSFGRCIRDLAPLASGVWGFAQVLVLLGRLMWGRLMLASETCSERVIIEQTGTQSQQCKGQISLTGGRGGENANFGANGL